jgi:hypothetical protein
MLVYLYANTLNIVPVKLVWYFFKAEVAGPVVTAPVVANTEP